MREKLWTLGPHCGTAGCRMQQLLFDLYWFQLFDFPCSRSYKACSTTPLETVLLQAFTTLDTFVVTAMASDIVSAMVAVVPLYCSKLPIQGFVRPNRRFVGIRRLGQSPHLRDRISSQFINESHWLMLRFNEFTY